MILPLVISAVVGYLLGSLPFGYLVARAKGLDIFKVGSGNPGATNVRRVLGHGAGNTVLVLDVLKGALAVGWLPLLRHFGGSVFGCEGDVIGYQQIIGLVAATLGHSFSCFTKFKGGKGVATAGGGFLVLFTPGAAIALVIFGLTVVLTRYVSLASILAAASLPFSGWALHQTPLVICLCALVAAFVIVRHRSNISRLLAGTENKAGQKKPDPAI